MLASAVESFDYDAALKACAARRTDALHGLYQHEADRLFGVALRIVRRRDLAEDVVHDAFVQVWRKASTFDPRRGTARAWLAAIVRNRALNMLRSGRRTDELDPATLEDIPDSADEADVVLERIDDRERLATCLGRLDEKKRTSILLAYVDGLSQTQIATRLGEPHNTVKAWIRRGLLALRECLQ